LFLQLVRYLCVAQLLVSVVKAVNGAQFGNFNRQIILVSHTFLRACNCIVSVCCLQAWPTERTW